MESERTEDTTEQAAAGETGVDAPDPMEIEAFLVELGLDDTLIDGMSPESREAIHRLAEDRRTAEEAKLRTLADFRNFQRRSIENETRAHREGKAELVRELLPAIDQFDLALQSAESATSVDQVVTGVRMVRDELLRAFASRGVEELVAATGDEFEPGRHEAIGMMPPEHVEGDAAAGSVAVTVSPGFAIGDYILRPAKVMLVQGDD